MIPIKFGDILKMAEDESFVHPESSKLPAVVHSAVYKVSKSGNDMLVTTFRITGGKDAGRGRPIRHFILINDSGRQQLSNLGFPAKDFATLATLDASDAFAKIAAVIVGKPCAVDVYQDTYEGRLQNKIKWVHPASAAASNGPAVPAKPKPEAKVKPSEETPAEDVDDDDEDLDALAAKIEAKRKARAKRTPPPAPSDGLPF